jgi:hypothetical protein
MNGQDILNNMAGNKNSGRRVGQTTYAVEEKGRKLKGVLLDAVLKDCKEHPEKKLYWAKEYGNKVLPQTVEGTGPKGEIAIKVNVFRDV